MVYERDKQWFEDEFEQWNNPDYCKTAVQKNGFALKYVLKQTPMLCRIAVKQNGYALQYVQQQTPKLCQTAVKKNGYALLYVRDEATFKQLLSKA
jgi:hypothetical protein